ncbi:hypothetical protein JOB18_030526 [Solea senegalensis]|uniref:HNH endonuclease n=1 Tax=Solea senegalensis TaxID=28829 RepID=A0AAV6STE2_SOLSE|nr:hypothetical protein JOB18_030526 [Solea senegalensis]
MRRSAAETGATRGICIKCMAVNKHAVETKRWDSPDDVAYFAQNGGENDAACAKTKRRERGKWLGGQVDDAAGSTA